MEVAANLALIALSSFVLIKSVNLFIRASSKIAQFFNLSGYTISFLLVGVATSFPEVSVAITSALEKQSILSYGDALGSNIALLTIMTAIPGFMGAGLSTKRIFKSKDIHFAILFALLVLALSFDRVLGRVDGILLIIAYIVYFISFLRRQSKTEQIAQLFTRVNIWKEFTLFFASLMLLLVTSRGIVMGALNLSSALGLKLVLVGLTITALGTNMPEFAYIIKKGKDGGDDEVLGDIVGSVVANTTLVLGLAATIYPIELNGTLIGISSFGFLLLALFLFFIFSKTRQRVEKWEAVILVLVYIAFLVTEFYVR